MKLNTVFNSKVKQTLAVLMLFAAFFNPVQAHELSKSGQVVSNPLVFMVEFNIKPESKEAFLKSLGQVIEDMSKEDTFITTYLHADSKDPNKFIIYERWAEPSLEAFMENQLRSKRYRDYYEENLPSWSSEPRKITILNPITQ